MGNYDIRVFLLRRKFDQGCFPDAWTADHHSSSLELDRAADGI
jgi:hypothetical protein